MKDRELISQGAEARLYKTKHDGKDAVAKQRYSRRYRHPALDKKLLRHAFNVETKNLTRADKIGISVPKILYSNKKDNLIIMDLLPGATLKEYLIGVYTKHKTYPDSELPLLKHLGYLLAKLHNNSMTHGDLTSSNIIIEPKTRKLSFIDFGLSFGSARHEDKAVDLYLLERAFKSTHPEHQVLVDSVMKGYEAEVEERKPILTRLAKVRSRGRKRTEFGRVTNSMVSFRRFSSTPEHVEIILPAMSPSMDSGELAEWAVSEGDHVEEGSVYGAVVTDKATVDFNSVEDGWIAKLTGVPGETYQVGEVIGIQVLEEEDIPFFKDWVPETAPVEKVETPKSEPEAAPVAEVVEKAPVQKVVSPPVADDSNRIIASPYARNLAKQKGIDLRIVASDLNNWESMDSKAMPAGEGAERFIDTPLTPMRSTIARRLLESKTEIPHYQLSMDVNMDELVLLRSRFNERLAKTGEGKLSVNDYIVKASALACLDVPEVNSQWHGDFIRQFDNVDISIAVATDAGLITPVVRNVERLGLRAISTSIKELAGQAHEGTLQPEQYEGGTFTISNLGMFGITSFNAIINPPQSCILAVGGSQKRAVMKGDEVVESTFMNVTLSCDHRVVDGAVGARWLQAFQTKMEDPAAMLL